MNDKKYYWTAAIIVILVVAGVIIYKHYDKNDSSNGTSDQQMTQGPQATASSTDENVSTSTNNNSSGKLSYADAIVKYKNRFQFSQCHGTPGYISVRAGTAVMLDNRDKTAHTIKANGQSVRIAALDYAVIYPTRITADSTSAETSNITCDGGGAATLNVEK